MTRKTVSNKMVAVSLLIIVFAVFIGLDVLGVVKWLDRLNNIPVIGAIMPSQSEMEAEEEEASPLEIENKALREELLALQQELTGNLGENNRLQQENIQLRETIAELTDFKNEIEAHQATVNELAAIYETMRPSTAARIFEELNDELIINILSNMPLERTTQILAQMEPEMAGRLTAKMVN